MKKLAADLKNGEFNKLYLFFGSENYLIRRYENVLKSKLFAEGQEMMNTDVFTGKNAKVDEIFDAVSTMPFMADYRLVIVKDSGLFASGRKNDSAKAVDYLKDLPETSVLLFMEDNVDKRSAMYKTLAKEGRSVEFNSPPENELADWIIRLMKQSGIAIDKAAAVYLVRSVSQDMDFLQAEMGKLRAYKGADGSITTEDIDAVCSKSLEVKIFALIDAVGSKQAGKALDIYQNLMLMRESPIMILTMIARQFRLILQSKELQKSTSANETATLLGVRPFVVSECLRQGKNFSTKDLTGAIKDCLEADVNIKTGKMADKLAVELLIIKYSVK